MTLHYAPTTAEEEELAIALALSASLTLGKVAGTSRQRENSLSFSSNQRTHGNSGPSISHLGQHPPSVPQQLPPPVAQHAPPVAQQRPQPMIHPAPPMVQQPSPAARALPPGLGSPPHIFPTRMPLPQPPPRLPVAPARQGPQHQRSTSTLPTVAVPHPSQHNRSASSTSPLRGSSTWGGLAPISGRLGSQAGTAAFGVHAHPSNAAPGGAVRPAPQPEQHAAQPPLPPTGRSHSATGPSGPPGGGGGRSSGSGSSGSGGGAFGDSAAGGGRGSCVGGTTPPPRVGTASPASPPSPPAPQLHSDPNACAGCGRGFGLFASDCITGMGRKWHTGCFRCGFCSEPISTGRGTFSYNMHPGDARPYHSDCYRHVHHPVCHVCATYIPPGPDGRISYRENGFWRQRYCNSHAEESLTRCCGCSRLQKQGEEWAPLHDGRPLCLQCLSTTVLDTREAQPLYDDVLRFFAEEMHLPHPYKAPLLLVDGPTLNEHAMAEGRDDSGEGPVFHVRGLCVAQVYSHIPAILRGLGGGLQSIATALSPASSPTAAVSATAPQRAHCHVSVLLLLYGLPRLLSGSIMAHELMHAWLRMAGLVGLPLRAEEGLCQLMACLWLDRQHELLLGEPDEQRLASFFSYQIRTDTSEVYGDGFRDAMEAFQSHGLTTIIQNLKLYGCFTPP